jgi:hypothetical protein
MMSMNIMKKKVIMKNKLNLDIQIIYLIKNLIIIEIYLNKFIVSNQKIN